MDVVIERGTELSVTPAPAQRAGAGPGLSLSAQVSALPMINPVRGYDWGSRHALAHLQGREPTGAPEAELWMGSHPSGPSMVCTEDGQVSLGDLIAADPRTMLGQECSTRFGPRLPFLLKVLAVEQPLSIQVHPSSEQARAGFARQERDGVPLGARERTYVDTDAKPELLYAVTRFEALAGLRPRERAAHLLGLLGTPRLAPVLAELARERGDLPWPSPGRDRPHRGGVLALATLAGWPVEDRAAFVAEVAASAAIARAELAHGRPEYDRDGERALRWLLRLAEQYPRDTMVLAPLLLQLHRFQPGDTMFVPAGVPHGHLTGMAVEIMSCSDNVVRAGLTSKHVDVDELVSLLDPAVAPMLDVPSWTSGGGAHTVWAPPVEEFWLARIDVDGDARLDARRTGPQVVLCMRGEVSVCCGGTTSVRLTPGQSAFLPAAALDVTLNGRGEVFLAAVP